MHDQAVLIEINSRYVFRRDNRKFKLELLAAFKTCYWCGVECKDYPHKDFEQQEPDSATIDHTISRFYRQKGESVLKVLACYACNQRRAKEEGIAFYKNKIKRHNHYGNQQSSHKIDGQS